MASADETTAIEAILAANESYSTDTQHNATEWLSTFMETDAAWPVWRHLLSHGTTTVRFFAANALTQKIRRYWDTLDMQQQGELKDELFELACCIVEDRIYQLRLCMGIAAIAVRTVDSVWYGFWQDMVTVFERGLPSSSLPLAGNSQFSTSEGSNGANTSSFNTDASTTSHTMTGNPGGNLAHLSLAETPTSPSPAHSILNPTRYAARMAVLQVLSSLPNELERVSFSEDRTSAVLVALKAGVPEMLQIVQEVLKYPSDADSGAKTKFARSGSAPPGLSHASSSLNSLAFSTPLTARNTWSRARTTPILSTMALKKSALEVLQCWVSCTPLATPLPSKPQQNAFGTSFQQSQQSSETLRQTIHSQTSLLPLLFDALKKPQLSTEAGEILLALFTRRTLSETQRAAPSNLASFSPASTPSGGASTSFFVSSGSRFTSASQLTQTSLQKEDDAFIENLISQLLNLVESYREATMPFLEEKQSHQRSAHQLADEYEENVKLCRAIVLMFVGVGESNCALLYGSATNPLMREYFEVLLEMTAHPLLDIAELAMQFWNTLEYHICGNPDFAPLYERLLKNTLHTCTFPSFGPDPLGLGITEAEWEDCEEAELFGVVRESAVQTLRACYSVLGDQFLVPIQELVDEAGHDGDYDARYWRALELAFFAATTVNLHVPSDAPLISQLFRIAFSLPIDLSQQGRTHAHKSPHSMPSHWMDSSSTTGFGIGSMGVAGAGGMGSSNKTSPTLQHLQGQSYTPSSSSFTLSATNSPQTNTTPLHTNPHPGDDEPTLHDLQFPPHLLISIARFIGEYRVWITQSCEEPLGILDPALMLCLQWATAPNSELAFSASIAAKDLCLTAAPLLSPHLFSLAERYSTYYEQIRGEDRVTLAVGLTSVLKNIQSLDEMVNALQYLWAPTLSTLKGFIDMISSSLSPISSHSHDQDEDHPLHRPYGDLFISHDLEAAVCTELDVLGALLSLNTQSPRSLLIASVSCPSQLISYDALASTGVGHARHPIVLALQSASGSSNPSSVTDEGTQTVLNSELFLVLDHLVSIWLPQPSHEVSDRICSLYNNLLSSCQESFEPLLAGTMERVLDMFLKQRLPACLQTISIAVSQFGNDTKHLYCFSRMILDVSNAVYQSDTDPEILVAFFDLCSSILGTNPDILVQRNGADALNSLIQVCMQATNMDDTTLVNAGLGVLDRLMFGRHVAEREAWKQFVTTTVEQLGLDLMAHLLKCAVNTSHHKTMLLLSTVLHKLVQTHNPCAKQALTQLLSQDSLPGNLSFTEGEREMIVNIFLEIRSSIQFRQFLSDFIDVANRRAETSVFNQYEASALLEYDSQTHSPHQRQQQGRAASPQNPRTALTHSTSTQTQLFSSSPPFHSRSTPHVI